jgi:hypothetical protein
MTCLIAIERGAVACQVTANGLPAGGSISLELTAQKRRGEEADPLQSFRVTDANGQALFESLAPGSYFLAARARYFNIVVRHAGLYG